MDHLAETKLIFETEISLTDCSIPVPHQNVRRRNASAEMSCAEKSQRRNNQHQDGGAEMAALNVMYQHLMVHLFTLRCQHPLFCMVIIFL